MILETFVVDVIVAIACAKVQKDCVLQLFNRFRCNHTRLSQVTSQFGINKEMASSQVTCTQVELVPSEFVKVIHDVSVSIHLHTLDVWLELKQWLDVSIGNWVHTIPTTGMIWCSIQFTKSDVKINLLSVQLGCSLCCRKGID